MSAHSKNCHEGGCSSHLSTLILLTIKNQNVVQLSEIITLKQVKTIKKPSI